MRRWASERKVCEALGGISRSTLNRWVNDPTMSFAQPYGWGPHSKRFDMNEVEAWIESRRGIKGSVPDELVTAVEEWRRLPAEEKRKARRPRTAEPRRMDDDEANRTSSS